jgi:hypothetical protein
VLGYQVARRLRDDEAITQLLELGVAHDAPRLARATPYM